MVGPSGVSPSTPGWQGSFSPLRGGGIGGGSSKLLGGPFELKSMP